MSDAAGTKRAAPDDFDSSTADARPAPALRSGSSPFVHVDERYSPQDVVKAVTSWIERFETKVNAEQDVVLEREEAWELLLDLRNIVAGFQSAPATKGDIVAVLDCIDQLEYHFIPPEPPRRFIPPPQPPQRSTFQRLPFDVVRLIVLELRDLWDEDVGEGSVREWHITDWQRTLRRLRLVGRNMKEVCDALRTAELAVTAVEDLPRVFARMTTSPQGAEDLRRMLFYLRDLDQLGHRSATDAAFSLPDVIRLGTNVTSLTLTETYHGHPDFSESLRYYVSRRGYSFDEVTGGVSVPDTIVSLPHLRELRYGAPCDVGDIVKFITAIPTLKSLEICGLVNHDGNAETRPASASLRRLWMPGVAVPPAVLGRLLGVPPPPIEGLEDDDEVVPRPHLRSLAFTFDPENAPLHTGPNEQAEIDALMHLFGNIGSRLVELNISLPGADDNGAFSVLAPLFGAGGGAAAAGAFAAILPLPLGPAGAPPAPAGAAPVPAGAAPQGVPGAGAAGGPWNAAAAPRRGVPARRGVPLARGGGPPAPARGHQAAAAAPQGGAGGGGAPPPPQGAPPPAPPGGAAGGGLGPNGLANLNQLFALRAVRPEHAFFAELLQHCPKLEHLELYGRRYDASLVDVLRTLPLRHLALSVPNTENRASFIENLLKALEEGALELSARGGDWAPSERRQVKVAAEKRSRLEYRSTDLKR